MQDLDEYTDWMQAAADAERDRGGAGALLAILAAIAVVVILLA